ncbi:MAG: hypothetical protein H7Z18_09020 [Methylophilaceae bacterium]|nr:hypothetical protein [Methylophilaceae bacterium]
MFRILRLALSFLMIASQLAACGFQLRGQAEVSFNSIYLQGQTLSISKALRKNLIANNIKVLPTAENADVLLELSSEQNEKRILSLSGGGVVKEYELFYRVHYRLRGAKDAVWTQEQIIEVRRDFSYSDAELLAKQGEEARLYSDMRSDVLNNLLRRLTRFRPSSTADDAVTKP